MISSSQCLTQVQGEGTPASLQRSLLGHSGPLQELQKTFLTDIIVWSSHYLGHLSFSSVLLLLFSPP